MSRQRVANSNQRMVCDPTNRKSSSWKLRFVPGAAGHIIDKHVARTDEPWAEVIGEELASKLSMLSSQNRTSTHTDKLKQEIFDHVECSCKRPQAMTFDERRSIDSPASAIRCCLLVCRCGLLIAIRNIDTEPMIHTAFFRRGVLNVVNRGGRWKTLVRQLRSEHVYAERESGKLAYPTPDVVKPVSDDEIAQTIYWRAGIDFHSKHTWGFLDVNGVWRPIGEIPAWQERTT